MSATHRAENEAGQLFRLCLVKGSLDEKRAQQVVQQLAEHRPRGCLATLSCFRRLVEQHVARRTAVVQSATSLPADLRQGIEAGLAHHYGPGLTVSFSENPKLIAGMRIQVGSDVFDGSVRARLATLERSF